MKDEYHPCSYLPHLMLSTYLRMGATWSSSTTILSSQRHPLTAGSCWLSLSMRYLARGEMRIHRAQSSQSRS